MKKLVCIIFMGLISSGCDDGFGNGAFIRVDQVNLPGGERVICVRDGNGLSCDWNNKQCSH